MNIGIDGHCVGDRSGGNETYWNNLIHYLDKIDNSNIYKIFLNHDEQMEFDNRNFESIHYIHKNALWRNSISLPYNSQKLNLDIIHTQYFMPYVNKNKSIVTIHDISYEHYPECFTKKELMLNKLLIKKAAKNCKYIITVSDFSKKDISKTYNIDPDKIFVTYLGANEIFKPISDIEKIENIKRKYNIQSEYLLTVGNLQPRKNLERLIKAFEIVKTKKEFRNLKLVLVGKKAWKNNETFKDMKYIEDIVITGYVPDEDLPYLYNGCSLFVYPSIFEGFGLPVLEALNCGKAILTSCISSLPEVIGNAGAMCNPFDIQEIADNIIMILSNRQLKKRFENEALNRAEKFSWKQTAFETLEVYKKLMIFN